MRLYKMNNHSNEPAVVAHVIWSLGLGGAEQVVIGLVRALDRTRYRPIVVCLDDKGAFASGAEAAGVPVFEMRKRRGLDVTLPFRLAKLFRENKVKLVHTHLFNGHLWGRLGARFAGLPVVSTEHGMDAWRTPVHHFLSAVLTDRGSRVVFVSEEAREFYQRRVPGGAEGLGSVIFNGIETARFENRGSRARIRTELGFAEGDFVVGTAGRFVPEKRHDVFFAALKKLKDMGVPVKGLVIGGGPLQIDVAQGVKKEGLEADVVLAGVRQDLPDVYPAMDAFMLSSDREGLPITILEAMASGTPVVSTNVGGIHSCIRGGKTGWLVEAGNPEALAGALQEVYAEPSRVKTVTEAACETVKSEFSVQAMTSRYEALYEEVMQ